MPKRSGRKAVRPMPKIVLSPWQFPQKPLSSPLKTGTMATSWQSACEDCRQGYGGSLKVNNHFDFMIAGQGLAGCLLARRLRQDGASCVLVGKSIPKAATPVAAGIMNPITGKRLAKSWRTEPYLAEAKNFYRVMGKEWGETLLHEGHILRFPRNEKEIALFRKRKADPLYNPFLGAESPPCHWTAKGWTDKFGSYEIRGVSWVDLEKVASTIRREFQEQNIFREEYLEHKDLEMADDGIVWKDLHATCIVFCEGAKVLENPWFQFLPFGPSRGETLDLQGTKETTDFILQSRYWLLATEDGSLRAGSTYDHDGLEAGATSMGQQEILDGLAGFLSNDFSVIAQRCGIRPSTRDRLPVMGRHPKHPQIALFNGFGSKGATWAPSLAKHFASHLIERNELDQEVDLLRFNEGKPR
ncbi:MAG: hypothetical protein CMI31_05890 [Opitutae bacterium]|nr:hypothetical protein [Opitutae bacterium]